MTPLLGVAGLRAKSPTDNFKVTPKTLAPSMTKTTPNAPTTQSTASGVGNYNISPLRVSAPTSNQNQPGLLAPLRPTAQNPNPFKVSTPTQVAGGGGGGSYGASGGTPTAYAATTPQTQTSQTAVNPRDMTPAEANGGAAGLAAWQQRLGGLGGNTGSPNGPAPQQSTQGSPSNGMLQQLIEQLRQGASGPSGDYLKAQKQAEMYNKALTESKTNQANTLANNFMNPIPLEFQQGRGQVLTNQYLAQQGALASGFQGATNLLGAANTQQGLQQQGLTSAAGLAQPVQVPYSNQFVDPLTGQTIGGQGGGVGGSLQTAVQDVSQRVKSGTMTYNDALSALSSYGQGGVNALLQSLGSNFNIAQSNTLAGQQGSVGVNYQLAETALNNVENIMKSLGAAQTTNIPFINSTANWISTQFGLGSEQTRAMTGAVQSLRNAYASLLASVKGGTPTDYSSQAAAEIPNEPTPNDIAAVRQNFEVLGKARRDILSNPGAATGNQNQSSGSGGIFDW